MVDIGILLIIIYNILLVILINELSLLYIFYSDTARSVKTNKQYFFNFIFATNVLF